MTTRPTPDSATPKGTLPTFTPVPRKARRHDGWTPERQARFIEALADTGSVEAACRAVSMSTVGAYHLRRQEGADSFRAAWAAALDLGMQRIEDVAMERALNGVEVPVYSYGKLVGTRRVFNDRLLMFMLRNRAPERFGGARGMGGLNAIGKMELARLKKQWRAQWEEEQNGESEADVLASIDALIDTMARDDLRGMSPHTRAAKRAYEEARAHDRESGYCWYEDPDHPDYAEWHAQARQPEEPPTLPPPGRGQTEEDEDDDEETDPGPRIRTVQDERW